MRVCVLFTSFLAILCGGAVVAAEPGVVLTLNSGGKADSRVVPTISLYVPEGEAASPFLAPGPLEATFEGLLVLEKRSRLVFTMEGTGEATLTVDDEELVSAIGESNDSERLSSGEHKLVIRYKGPSVGAAQLRLFWEERDFDREPVPAAVLRHDPAHAGLADSTTTRHGRMALAEARCTACHQAAGELAMPELTLSAPSLSGIGARVRADWLAKWIANPPAVRPSAHMPVVFKEGAEQKAADIAAYLSAEAPKVEAVPAATPEQVKQGGHLFHQQGCIACHSLDSQGDADRIGLQSIGKKFRLGALASFLREPAKFHQATRMPSFGFSEEEAAALEGFLRSLENDPGAAVPAGDPENGRKLLLDSGCLNCHEHTDDAFLAMGPPLAELKSGACEKVSYPEGIATGAITAFLADEQAEASLGRAVLAEFAHRQYAALQCNACHSQHGSTPLRDRFAEEVAHLKPPEPALDEEKPAIKTGAPPLEHLGLKLRPEWRAKLFSGEIEPKVRKWLPARMPAFPSRALDLAAGFSHAAGVAATSPDFAGPDPEMVATGKALTGIQGGLACGTCHGIGDQPAIAVFEGEGPNFRDAGARLSLEYFHLWMNDPPRVWPGTIMPKYAIDGKTPLTQHYDGDAHQQFEAIYHYLRALSNQ